MDDNTAKKNDDVRELVFDGIAYTDIGLPDLGQVRIHPYISAGAMDAYGSVPADPKAAFQAMFAESREEKVEPIPVLTADDADVIARLYAEKDGFLDQYIAARATSTPFDAFGQAIKESALWRDRAESQRQIEAMLEKHERVLKGLTSFPRALEATFQNLTHKFDILPKFTLPEFKVPDLSALVETRSIALQVTSLTAQMDLLGIDRVSRTIADGLGRWTELTRGLANLPDYGAFFRDHTRYIEQVNARTLAAESLLKSHADVLSSFERVAQSLRLPEFRSFETLGVAQRAFADSEAIVRSVGKFFEAPKLPRAPIGQPAVLPAEMRRALDTEAEIEEAADESETLVHTTTGRLIIVGNEALVGLQQLMGEVVDERLGPLAPLLKRLQFLANPNNFSDLLHSFARYFQRDHWKSLWTEFGAVFKPRPEEIAQSLLTIFLQGHFGGIAFVGRELGNGDGFVDVLVNFLGIDYVVEVKIVGVSWGIGGAKDGLDQLDAYVQNYNAASAYLLVFDGRKSEKGEQLNSEYRLKSGATARVVVVRSYFDAPSKRR
ncbi:MAG TPA: hypothetical protein VG815_21625 [Chloroflexota bacterium]|nr:hypothetical protein [Chloroflexota bacterium]